MKTILNRLTNHETLKRDEAREILLQISGNAFNPCQIAGFLTVFLMRGITIEELEGFRDAMLDLCVKVDFDGIELMDFCGTGGDGKNTFNISTLSAFVASGAGFRVAKHSNYGVSSNSGSSNVLEQIGIKFTNRQDFLKRAMDNAGIVFLHAPLFHPSMKNVAPIRKDLGVKTFFNILGPLSNPAPIKNQLTGVFSLELARIYGYLFQNTDKRYSIVHALDGYDEISLTGPAKVISNRFETILNPEDFGASPLTPLDISGGDNPEAAAKIFMDIINGHGTQAQNSVVCANAGLAIATAKNIGLAEGFLIAEESLKSGKALSALGRLQTICKSL